MKKIETLAQVASGYKCGGKHMVNAIGAIQSELARILPDPFTFKHGDIKYVANLQDSNVGYYGVAICYVARDEDADIPDVLRPVAGDWSEAGNGYYLHGDFHSWVSNAQRWQVKIVAKQLPCFIEALCDHLQKEREEMVEATVVLVNMIEAVKD